MNEIILRKIFFLNILFFRFEVFEKNIIWLKKFCSPQGLTIIKFNSFYLFKGSFLTNESKSQTNVGSQPNFNQPSIICSSNSTLSSIQVNIEKNNSLNGSKTVLVTDQTNPLVKSVSLTKAQSNDNLTKYKEFPFQSQSANNFHPSQDLKKNSSQSTVYVIPNKKISNTGPETKSPTIDENSRVNTPLEDNIVIDQTSTLGILVQIKVLEDKVNL